MQSQNIRVRIQKNAKNLRFISRDQMFQKNRKNQKQQLSYLKTLPQQQRQQIVFSLTSPIPQPLPPLTASSISYYRRANIACFKTHLQQSPQFLHPHLCYQSLFMLAGVQQMNFSNYQSIVKQFQSQLQQYIISPFAQIRQMSMIAAGNKIIGRQKQIQQIVSIDPKQLWVMINHIYQRKMSSSNIFPYIGQHNQIVYKSLFEMTNTNDDDIIQLIMSDDQVLEMLVKSLTHYIPDIKKYTIRIFGNIMAEKQQYVYDLAKHDILNHFYPFLTSTDEQLRKDACWAISNFVFQKVPSTNLLFNTKLTQKLIHMLQTEWDTKIKIQLFHIFSNLVAFADKPQVLKVITTGRLLQKCGQFLQIDDPQLIHVSLYLISKIVELGDHFADQDGNVFINQIKTKGIKGKIIEKTYYTENSQISKLSSELEEKLEEEF